MWRAAFLALGITLCILGGECLIVDKAVLAQPNSSTQAAPTSFMGPTNLTAREIEPPEWAPWSLLSGGAVILLYSYTLPRRVAG